MREKRLSQATVSRWGKGIRVIAAGWFLLLFSAWMHKEVVRSDVLLLGALPAALYWTVGRALSKLNKRVD